DRPAIDNASTRIANFSQNVEHRLRGITGIDHATRHREQYRSIRLDPWLHGARHDEERRIEFCLGKAEQRQDAAGPEPPQADAGNRDRKPRRDRQGGPCPVKINAGSDLPVAPLGSSNNVQVGDWAIAVGN
ncbi:hypothetical protein FM036_44915, partial [Nostoc sp. HG1]|nr:hypothetical protein [Nostoc sp. HG1]